MMIDQNWVKLDDEVFGSTPDICWVMNRETRERALFKPDTFGNEESDHEWCTYQIAKFLGISSAKIEKINLFGYKGCLSYDCCDLKRYRYADGYSLYRCDKFFNNKKSDTYNKVYDSPIDVSFKGLLPYIGKQTETGLVNMIYLDWLVRNSDRHIGNISFYINYNRVICGLMPLYDHGQCLAGGNSEISIFTYDGLIEASHSEMLDNITRDYPDITSRLNKLVLSSEFSELVSDLGYSTFFKGRLNKLADINDSLARSSIFDKR